MITHDPVGLFDYFHTNPGWLPRCIDMAVVHCSATPPDMDIGSREITGWHLRRGFTTIGYHFVIRRNGQIEKGRGLDTVGAHARGYNAHSIGICLVGGVDDANKPEDNFTPQQMETLQWLLYSIRLCVPDLNIVGHNELDSNKACPSFNVRDKLPGFF